MKTIFSLCFWILATRKMLIFVLIFYLILWTFIKGYCGVGEDSWESLGLQGDPTSPSWRKSVLVVHWKDWCWSWNSNTLATWCEELTHWKRPWCWEGLGARGEGDDRGWDGWMASPTQWTWVWIDSGSLWWTGRPGMLRFMGSQRIGHDWVTELNRLLCMSCFLNFILGLSVSCQNNTQGCPFRVFNLDRMLAVDAVEEIASWGGSFNTISL